MSLILGDPKMLRGLPRRRPTNTNGERAETTEIHGNPTPETTETCCRTRANSPKVLQNSSSLFQDLLWLIRMCFNV